MPRGRRTWTMMGFVAAFLVVMNLPLSISQKMRHGASEAAAPLQRMVRSVAGGVGSTFRAVTDRKGLVEENEELRQQVAELQHRLQEMHTIEKENLQLSRELKVSARSGYRQVAAKVIGRDIDGWWRMVHLDRGARDGIALNQAVVTSRGLVGKIADVTSRTSKVLLISDPGCRVSVRLADKPASGVLAGAGVSLRGRVHCRLDLINKDIEVDQLDKVVTTGTGGVFPGGIDIGFVDSVELDSGGLYQRATIVPAVDLAHVGLVFVIVDDRAEAP